MTRSRKQTLLIVAPDQSAQYVKGKVSADWPTLLRVSKQEAYVIPEDAASYKYTIRPFVLDEDELLNIHKRNLEVGEGIRSLIPKTVGSVAIEGKGMLLSVDGMTDYDDNHKQSLDTAKDQNIIAETHQAIVWGNRLHQYETIMALAFLLVVGACVLFFLPDIVDRVGEVDVTQVVSGGDKPVPAADTGAPAS